MRVGRFVGPVDRSRCRMDRSRVRRLTVAPPVFRVPPPPLPSRLAKEIRLLIRVRPVDPSRRYVHRDSAWLAAGRARGIEIAAAAAIDVGPGDPVCGRTRRSPSTRGPPLGPRTPAAGTTHDEHRRQRKNPTAPFERCPRVAPVGRPNCSSWVRWSSVGVNGGGSCGLLEERRKCGRAAGGSAFSPMTGAGHRGNADWESAPAR